MASIEVFSSSLHWLTFFFIMEKKSTNDPINVNVQSVLYWNFMEFFVQKMWCKKISEHQSICQIRFFFFVIHFNYKCAFLSHVDFFSDFIYSHISRMRLKKFVKLHQQQPRKKWHSWVRVERHKILSHSNDKHKQERRQELNIPYFFFAICYAT